MKNLFLILILICTFSCASSKQKASQEVVETMSKTQADGTLDIGELEMYRLLGNMFFLSNGNTSVRIARKDDKQPYFRESTPEEIALLATALLALSL